MVRMKDDALTQANARIAALTAELALIKSAKTATDTGRHWKAEGQREPA
jgi:hypothetical protein